MVRTLRYLTAFVFFVGLLFIPGAPDGFGRDRAFAAMGAYGGVDVSKNHAGPHISLRATNPSYVRTPGRVSDVTLKARAGDGGGALQTPPPIGPIPILIIASPANPFTRYYAEILRAEGLNGFEVLDIDTVTATPARLNSYDVVILGEMNLTAVQSAMLSNWVTGGGNLIAMRPDKQLYSLLGLSATSGTLSDAYLLFDRTTRPAAGLVGETIQFHGAADLAGIAALNGASTLATLYSDANTSAGAPAVTVRNVGANGGHAAAFLFDLAKSVVYTRQGNPAWSGQERDGIAPIRSDDLFFGAKPGDVRPDWVDFTKVAIPQADEQQRLLANLILDVNVANKPLPRFWYFPRGGNAVVVMTGDDHGNGGTVERFEQQSQLKTGCSVADWECIRSTSYIYPGTIPVADANDYVSKGFEVALHVNTQCADWTASSLAVSYASQLEQFALAYRDVPPPATNRTHCVVWSDYATQPAIQLANGIRLDTSYYYYPGKWVQGRPGLFTGSGMPMRFAKSDGTMIDVYQAATQMTDESMQAYPATAEDLLNKAVGPEGYYGVFTANMHTDYNQDDNRDNSAESSELIIDAALNRGVPVVSAKQMLEWVDGRNGSSFSITAWDGGTLGFSIVKAPGANGLQAMLPVRLGSLKLNGLTRVSGAAPVRTVRTIKGIDYAFFTADTASYVAAYVTDATAPVISNLEAVLTGPDTAVVSWTTDEPATSSVHFGTAETELISTVSNSTYTMSHSVTLTGLTAATRYYFRVTSADGANPATSGTSPNPPAAPATFRTRGPEFVDTTLANFSAGTPGSTTYVSETTDGEVILKPTVGTEFSTPGLPADWFIQEWAPAGAATVAGGLVAVDGAVIGQNGLYEAGRSLEFVATFSDDFQHIGFGIDFSTQPWAIFGTVLNRVYARTNNGTTNISTPLGVTLFGSPHRYRIQWTTSGVTYFVDDVEVASHPVSITAPMRPLAASDYTLSGAQLKNDWFRMSPYAATGTFVSRVFDSGDPTNQWGALSWTAATPTGTSVAFSVRTGQLTETGIAWTPWRALPSSASQVGATSQYLQYRVTLSTSDPQITPQVQRVVIQYDADEPVVGNSDAPIITLPPTPASAGTTSAVITWTTNVPASSEVESVGQPSFVAVNDPELTTTHQVTILGLVPGTTYSYKITSRAVSGASSSEPVTGELKFTTLAASFMDTTVADFTQGVRSNTSVTSTGDGAVSLIRSPGTVDWGPGPGLPAGWLNNQWETGGNAIVEGGALKVAGGWASTAATFAPGQSVEFVATFSANTFQHVGFAENLAAKGAAWALFSTRGTNHTLYASTSVGSTVVDSPIPVAFLGVPRTYRIDWTASSVVFSIDGVVVSAQAAAIPARMSAIAGQFDVGAPLTVASASLPSYTSSGTFRSRSFGTGELQAWDKLVASTDVPAGTTLTFTVYTGDTAAGPWTPAMPAPLPSSGGPIGVSARYLQYEATFSTTSPSSTPTILDVRALLVGQNVNEAPTASPRTVADNENTPITFTVTGFDPNGDVLTYAIVTQPSHGTLTGTGPLFTYAPATGFTGTDTFTFTVSDGSLVSSAAPVTIFVSHVNHVPLAANDQYTVPENTTLTVGGRGVLANDTDVDSGDVLAAVPVKSPVHGILTLNANGTFSYSPAPGYSGPDTFTYKVSDGAAESNVAMVTITVTAANTAPIASNDAYATDEDTPLTVAAPGLLGNDTDAETSSLTAVLVSNVAHGTLTLSANGSFTYTPDGNYNGSDSFTYKVNDGALESNVATVTITLNAVNDAPVAVADSYATDEDTALTMAAGVLGNDTDTETDSLTAVLVSDVAHGTLTLNANGSFTYTPDGNYTGSDSFTYKANDGALDSNVVTVTITVRPLNDAPVAVNDSYAIAEDGTLTVVPAAGVLANDSDVDNTGLTAAVVVGSGPAHGTLAFNADGSFTYTPTGNYNGPDGFTYQANDGTASSNVASVSINVTAVNDAPVAAADSYATDEDTALTVVPADGVLKNDTDVEPGTPTAVLVAGPTAAQGALVFNGDGSFTFTPAPQFNGQLTFTYQAKDVDGALSNIATVTITVRAVNDAPVAVADSYATDEDTALTVVPADGVLKNDTDVEPGAPTAALVAGPTAVQGALVFHGDGSFSFTPAPQFNGPVTFTYQAKDVDGTLSNIATVTIIVRAVNDAPVAVADSYATDEDTALTVVPADGVLKNDTDVEPGTPTAVLVAGPTAAQGALVFNGDGSFTFTPAPQFSGPVTFTYRAKDVGAALSNLATVTITVRAVNDAPVAVADSYATDEDTALTVTAAGVLGNDTDAENSSLTAVLVSTVAHGTLTLNANGSFTYTPAANYSGSDSFTYKAKDGALDSNMATVTIVVRPVNDAPVAVNDSYAVAEDGTLTVVQAAGVLANDSDVDNTGLTAALVVGSGPAHGTLTFNANGSFTYSPTGNYNGPDSFTYKASDGTANSNVATVSINVTAVNDAPVAMADSYATDEDTALTVAAAGVLGNDTDAETSSLTAVLVSNVAHGTLTLNANGSFTYTPAANYSGSDSFTYKAKDGALDSNVVTVTIVVRPVNDAPVAVNDSYSVAEDGTLTVVPAAGVLANDTDVDSTGLTAAVVVGSGPAHGTLTLNADGSFVYTPTGNYNGPDSFTYKASDGTASSNVATVSINVTAANDAPAAADQTVTTAEDVAKAIVLGGSDLDGSDALSFSIVTAPTHGTLSVVSGNQVTYTPAANYHGSDSVTFKVSDGTADSNVATVSINVTAVNDAPVAVNDSVATDEDTAVTVLVLANDTDADTGDTKSIASVTQGASGAVTINANGSLTYTPNANFTGTDNFTYVMKDAANALSSSATVTVTVNAVNDLPTISDTAPQTTVDGVAVGPLAVTVGDVETPAGSLVLSASSSNLTLVPVANIAFGGSGAARTVSISPVAGQTGLATITLTVTDGNGGTRTDQVQLTVNGASRATSTTLTSPTANPTTYGAAIVLNATVAVTSGTGTPTGSVEFFDGARSLGLVALTGNTASLTTTTISAGAPTTVTAVYRPTGVFATSTGTLNRTVNKAATTTSLTTSPLQAQYSDRATLTATISAPIAAASVTFKIGTVELGTAPVDQLTGKAILNAQLLGAIGAGAKTVTAQFNGVSGNHTVANASRSMSILREDATFSYTGPTTLKLSGGKVTLTVNITDAPDGNRGDVSAATVAFINRATGATIGTAAVVPNVDPTTGTATYSWTATAGTYTVGFSALGSYARNSTTENVVITIIN